MTCKCYHAERNFLGKMGVCWGTKECEACSCGGDESKCDFYDYVRERVKSLSQKQTNADRIRVMTDEELADWLDNNTYRFPIYKDWLEWLKQEARDEP